MEINNNSLASVLCAHHSEIDLIGNCNPKTRDARRASTLLQKCYANRRLQKRISHNSQLNRARIICNDRNDMHAARLANQEKLGGMKAEMKAEDLVRSSQTNAESANDKISPDFFFFLNLHRAA